jgi:hypothetical protein
MTAWETVNRDGRVRKIGGAMSATNAGARIGAYAQKPQCTSLAAVKYSSLDRNFSPPLKFGEPRKIPEKDFHKRKFLVLVFRTVTTFLAFRRQLMKLTSLLAT